MRTRAQGAAAELAGADAILVGSALMQAPEPAAKLRDLLARPLVKVCGLTREEDVAVAAEAGADLAGFILVPESPRAAKDVLPVPDELLAVAVWVGRPAERRRRSTRSMSAARVPSAGATRVLLRDGEEVARLLDLPWQQDDPGHWDRAASAPGRVVLAGKLAADNVGDAIRRVRPWAVDASSRLETDPGDQGSREVRAYVEAARGYDLRHLRRPVRSGDADPRARRADGGLGGGAGRRRPSRLSWTSSRAPTRDARRR